jgi:hypothetical protein
MKRVWVPVRAEFYDFFHASYAVIYVQARIESNGMPKRRQGRLSLKLLREPLLIIWVLVGLWATGIGGENGLVFAETPDRFQEYQVKAAFLYNFCKFVEWPNGSFPEKNSPFILAVLGKDPFGEALNPLNGKTSGNREIRVKRFANLDRLEKSHLLFINLAEIDQIQKALKTVGSWNVLTVSEVKGFTQAGGGIRFYIHENKVRFEINPDAAQRHGLKVSSQLLKLAKIVKED